MHIRVNITLVVLYKMCHVLFALTKLNHGCNVTHFYLCLFRYMYGDESDGAEKTKPRAEPPVTCKGLELMKVSEC